MAQSLRRGMSEVCGRPVHARDQVGIGCIGIQGLAQSQHGRDMRTGHAGSRRGQVGCVGIPQARGINVHARCGNVDPGSCIGKPRLFLVIGHGAHGNHIVCGTWKILVLGILVARRKDHNHATCMNGIVDGRFHECGIIALTGIMPGIGTNMGPIVGRIDHGGFKITRSGCVAKNDRRHDGHSGILSSPAGQPGDTDVIVGSGGQNARDMSPMHIGTKQIPTGLIAKVVAMTIPLVFVLVLILGLVTLLEVTFFVGIDPLIDCGNSW